MSANLYDSVVNTTVVADGARNFVDDQMLTNVSAVHSELFYPMGLRVVHPLMQLAFDGEQPCSLSVVEGPGRCEFLCLLSSEVSQGYSCACPPWKIPNGTLCESELLSNSGGQVGCGQVGCGKMCCNSRQVATTSN